jgi:hypothetical protein
MEILYYHQQVKYEKTKNLKNECTLKLVGDETFLNYIAEFDIEYMRFGKINFVKYEHALSYNIKNGDFSVIYRIINKKENTYNLYRTSEKKKKNNFEYLLDLTYTGFYSGEKRHNFWGIKYKRACIDMLKILSEKLNYPIPAGDKQHVVNPLYDMLVEHHLTKKNIKWHNNVYNDICQVFPQKKWLKLNDNKFLPAALDSLGIKSKLLVGVLSNHDKKINLKSLKFLCNLFGENYVDYFREFDWLQIVSGPTGKTKTFACEDDHEKRSILKALKSYKEIENIINDDPLTLISDLYVLKEFLSARGLMVKIRSKSYNELVSFKDLWEAHKKHFKLGYKLKYQLPEDMHINIESPITINDKTFIPELILTEEQFRLEGLVMKNCMGKQFGVANLYIHISLSLGKKRINLQYRRGMLNQSKGKANTNTPKEFKEAVEVLNQRMGKYKDVSPKKTSYDFINN